MKRISIFLMCLLLVVSCCFVGCSTFSIDYVRYYNEVVATVGDYEITRHELINSYNNYGYNYYVSQQGKSEQEALELTLGLMIDRKLLAEHAKTDANYALTGYDINSIYQKVINSLMDSYRGYLTSAREIYDVDAPETAEEAEDSAETFKKADYKYKKRAELEYGSNKIVYLDDGEEEIIEEYALDRDFVDNYNSKTKQEIVTKIYAKFMEKASYNQYNEEMYAKLHDKAIGLMSKYLISYEYYLRDDNNQKFSTDTPSLMKRLIERMLNSEIEGAYIKNVEDYYISHEVLSVTKLLEKYVDLCETDYAKYVNSTTDYYNYLKTIGTNADMIYYSPNNDAEFGYFFHVLLPLAEDTTALIEEAKGLGIYNEAQLEAEIDNIVTNATHQERNTTTGELIDTDLTIGEILDMYKSDVKNVDDFIDFMFRFTSDTATLTADTPYVIGYEGNNNYSGMVTAFTEEAVRLMKNDLVMTEAEDYIITEYGIHLLYYVGEVEAKYSYEARNSVTISYDTTLANNLYTTYANEFIDKTYFDVLFDLVYPASDGSVYTSSNGYSDYEQSLISSLKDDKVTIYRTKLEGTLDL